MWRSVLVPTSKKDCGHSTNQARTFILHGVRRAITQSLDAHASRSTILFNNLTRGTLGSDAVALTVFRNRVQWDCQVLKHRQSLIGKGVRLMTIPQHDYTHAKSGMRGVHPSGSHWIATICVNYEQIYLGSFPTRGKAKDARLKAERKYYGEQDARRARPLPGFSGYSVTPYGGVFGRHGRLLSTWTDKDGYKHVNVALGEGKDAPRRRLGIHVLVCLTFHGPKPTPKHQVRHLDGSRDNNVPSNLCWGTQQENSDDRYIHGTIPYGPRKKRA